MKSQVNTGVMVAIIAVVVVVIGIISWRIFAPKHGDLPSADQMTQYHQQFGHGPGGMMQGMRTHGKGAAPASNAPAAP